MLKGFHFNACFVCECRIGFFGDDEEEAEKGKLCEIMLHQIAPHKLTPERQRRNSVETENEENNKKNVSLSQFL